MQRGRNKKQSDEIKWEDRSPRQNFMAGGGCGCGCGGLLLMLIGAFLFVAVPLEIWLTLSNTPYYLGFLSIVSGGLFAILGVSMYIASFFLPSQ